MRKEFKNAKAKHGLNSIIWIRLIGLSFLRDQNVDKRGEGEKKKKRKRKRRRKEEQKGMESNI